MGGGSALPLSSVVWGFGGASFGVGWGYCVDEGVPITSWRGWADSVLFGRAVGVGE